ncbi:LRR receptor-like serine/threonine-protein kinase [Perkinsela sp. CCAP 1560/4]|nr:LRR receptor-like serine/threonine-protein kinase [Perkinsela sp. CCAP 1560/4]|eukprot:KNH04486.1 LRR receptor-like serine/threonine-protein kinase [Perkinsela sp. CCAP 1560/4]
MFACAIALASGIRTVDEPVEEIQIQYQNECMRNTVGEKTIDRHERREKHRPEFNTLNVDRTDLDFCFWVGVTCRNGRIVGIAWNMSNHVSIQSLAWLPPSIERANITGKWIHTKLETHRLPKNIRHATFSSCGLHGSLELRELPVRLEELHLRRNKFTGEIRLTSLPPRMRIIDLERNKITRAFVSNDRLPGSLEKVDLFNTKGPRLVCLDGKKADPRIHLYEQYIELMGF